MAIPALTFQSRGRRAEPSPIHSDVAGFVGRTRRGYVGAAIRVEGLRRFQRLFGGVDSDLTLTYALRGYFENGGKVAYIVRVNGGVQDRAAAVWSVPREMQSDAPQRYRIQASSPGSWGGDIRVSWDWRHTLGRLVVSAPGEATEYHANLDARITPDDENAGRGITLKNQIYFDSDLIELEPIADSAYDESAPQTGTLALPWGSAGNEKPTVSEYLAAAQTLGDVPEVALLAAPGMYDDLDQNGQKDLIKAFLQQATELQDRLVVIDPPNPPDQDVRVVRNFVQELREKNVGFLRSGAVYGPWLRVPDPLGGTVNPLRAIPPSGHVAGVISRLDRDRGAHHTPANVSLLDAVDLEQRLQADDERDLNDVAVNLIRCQPGRGLMIWGGRTLDPEPGPCFVAHRRLIHRLVRAMRRVAEPIVFTGNTPALWLSFTRAITTVLLEAFRAGALKGERADEAFRVECNEKTNTEADQNLGRVVCLISLAPATPMEFITLRVALSETKPVEVFDA